MEATDQNKNPPASDGPAEIERLKEEARHEHDMYLRALADFENYRRRVERDRSTAARSGKRDVILPLLDVLDGFDRALSHIGDQPSSVAAGAAGAASKNVGRVGGARRHSISKAWAKCSTPSCTTPSARLRAMNLNRARSRTNCSAATAGAMTCSGRRACEWQ